MKQILVVIGVLAFSMAAFAAKSMPKLVHEARLACKTELGLPPGPPASPDDPKFKCLGKCIMERVGIITADGTYNDETVPEELKEASKKCFEENKELEACDRAHQFLKCTFKIIGQGMKELGDQCAKDTNTEIQHDGPGGHEKWRQFIQDDKLACYHRCMMIKMKKITENNELIVENLLMYVPDGMNAQEIADTCSKDNNQEDECMKAHKRGLCVLEAMKKLVKD